jgi:hypothetical protein
MVAYCSKQAHSSVERAGMLAGVTMHQIQTDDLCRSNNNLLSLCVFISFPTFLALSCPVFSGFLHLLYQPAYTSLCLVCDLYLILL